MEGWLTCLDEFSIHKDNPAWAKVAPAPELPKPLAFYSPMILPSFDEEEYMNRMKEDQDVANAVVPPVNEADKPVKEAGKTTTEEIRKTTAEGTGEDAARDPLPEL